MLHITDGFLIVLEGIDGCGKTTLLANLAYLLAEKQLSVITTREPGQTALGMKIREIVQERSVAICPKAEYLLFATNRAQHFDEFILPHLSDNELVISDRLFDSSLVYQGYARGLDIGMLHTVNAWVTHNRMPDLVIYVRVPVAVSVDRIKQRGKTLSAYEREHEEFANKVFMGYEELVAPRNNVLVVDGCMEADLLAKSTANKVYKILTSKGIVE